MLDLRLTGSALRDISDIEEFSAAEFGALQTTIYLNGLSEVFRRLLDYPDMGVRRDDLVPATRSLRYQSHRIYYRPKADGIVIQRVLHYARQVRREMLDDR